MKQIHSNNSTTLILERGEELIESLNTFAHNTRISGAWLSGLGAASQMTIGYYDLETREYVWTDIDGGVVEILNLTGNLSEVSEVPMWHVHGIFSGTDLKAFGGHVKRMIVGLTCEINITHLDGRTERKFDEETGLNLLGPIS